MQFSNTFSTVAFLLVTSSVRFAFAEESPSVGETSAALPGIHRVPIVGTATPRFNAAIDGGYGFTESQKSEGSHHRVLGSVGLGLIPMRGLEFGLLGGVRHDRHPDDGLGTDYGTIGHVTVVSRWGTAVGRSLRLGADLGATFPGAEKAADSLTSPAIDLRALFGWVPANGVRFAGFGGFRFDYTAGTGDDFARYRAGDRLALGASDFHAVLAGAGVVVPLGRLELLGEISGDLLVGSAAPKILESPIRIDLGLRQTISERFVAVLLSEITLSSRPDTSVSAPLVPVEPRFQVVAGLRYRLWGGAKQPQNPEQLASGAADSKQAPKKPETVAASQPTPPAVPQAPATSRVLVTVVDSAGYPLSDAVAKVTTAAGTSALNFENGSTFAADGVPLGRAHVTVQAELMRDWEQDIEITSDKAVELRIAMVPADNSGQIRGLVRAFDGRRLAARVHIEPGGRDVKATADGVFSVDVPPGDYLVKVSVDGYETQERTVTVKKNGVMVLNVDLRKGR